MLHESDLPTTNRSSFSFKGAPPVERHNRTICPRGDGVVSSCGSQRQSLTMRMAMRHVTRLMNRYARNLENHISSVATPNQAWLAATGRRA